jgi:signal transduction histidine kinase
MDVRRLNPSSLGAGALVLALLVINSLAVWGIVAARRDARVAAERDLELRTIAQARSLEAALASLRADLVFLSRSPPLTALVGGGNRDPVMRRWSRLDAEGTVLLFMEAHPAIEHLVVVSSGEPMLRVGREDHVPVLLPPGESASRAPGSIAARWPVGARGGGELEAWVEPRALLPAPETPRARAELLLDTPPGAPRVGARGDLAASVEVTDEGWDPPLRWHLVRTEMEGDLARSVEALAGRFGATVALNVAVMASSLLLGALTLRNLRRTTRLQAEREQQARVRDLERQVLHSERLASVGRIAAGFAHEINNPLEGISNYLALVREELECGRATEARPLVDRASEGVARAAGVIRQILAFSEPGSVEKTTLDLREIVAGAAAFVRSDPRYRSTAIDLALDSRPLLVHGNPTTLGQLVLNLLLNALQAMPASGPVELSASSAEGEVLLEVRDRGPGLPGAVRDHLFEPFTSTRGSSGLGLAVCRGIVQDHEGSIEARDRTGGGAVFVVRLPVSRAHGDLALLRAEAAR